MKIDFSHVILDSKGKPVKNADDKDTTLQDLAEQALLASFADEVSLPSDKKVERYKLFNKIDRKDWDLNAQEVTLLKFCIGKGFAPLAVGRAFDIIEAVETGN